ncbi:MAG: ComEC/Rec2 family competence protein [Holosporales bacterium]|jgi:competence protein ComEC|nr:ComEC/Rec2 family competence protein [Holosporales bacterium]
MLRNLSLYDALRNNLIEEKRRWFCWIPFFTGLGIASSIHKGTALHCLVIVAVVAMLIAIKKFYLQSLIVGFATAIGFFATELRNRPRCEVADTAYLSCKAQINKIDRSANSTTVIATIKGLLEDTDLPDGFLNSKIRVTAKGRIRDLIETNQKLLPQSVAEMRVMLFPLRQPQFPGDFDSKRIAVLRGISANGILLSQPKVISCFANELSAWIHKIRTGINSYFERHLDRDQHAISCALITGEFLVSQDLKNNFANAGMAHILAISGLHMCIFGGIIFAISRWILAMAPIIALRYDTKKIAAAISLIAATAYLFISGNKIPAIRALVVYAIVILGIFADRQPISMRSLAIAAIFIVLSSPESVLLPGFQMSFAATATLVAVYETKILRNFFDRARERRTSRIVIYVLSTICSTTAASLSVIPFTVNSFNKLTLNSIPSNILAIPLVGFVIIPGLIFALVFWWWPPVLECCFAIVNWAIMHMIKIADFVSDLPGSQIICPTPTKGALLLFVVSFLWLVIWQRKWRMIGLLGIAVSLGIYFTAPKPFLFIHGNGQAFAICSDDQVIVNTKTHARNTIKRWALSIGYDKTKKQNRDYFLLKNKQLLIIPCNSNISNDTLLNILPNIRCLVDLRFRASTVYARQHVTTRHLHSYGGLSFYEKHGSIEIFDGFGNKVSVK